MWGPWGRRKLWKGPLGQFAIHGVAIDEAEWLTDLVVLEGMGRPTLPLGRGARDLIGTCRVCVLWTCQWKSTWISWLPWGHTSWIRLGKIVTP